MTEYSSGANNYLPVADFYNGKSIFVTGGTGFVGKVLIEKLLWSCPGIENIYFFTRSKRNENVVDRLTEVLRTPVFDRLRKTRPNDLKKIIPISGDLSKPYLSINQSDKETIMRKVSVVFHVAATIRFDEPIKQSVTINTIGTKHLAEFCRQLSDLKAFVHVSTAYSNCDRKEIKEEIYSLPCDPDKVIQLMEITNNDDIDIADAITPILLGKRPNTYTYTKALAENVLQKDFSKLPIAIVRPSIILSSIKDPLPGWLDSWGGPSPFVAAGGKGFLCRLLGDGRMVADLIPADIVVNLTICAAWRAATMSCTPNIQVYNCCTGRQNPITWAKFIEFCCVAMRKNPPEDAISYPNFFLQRHRTIYQFQTFFMEKVPAFVFDFFNYLAGKKTNFMKIHGKLMKVSDAIAFVTAQQWTFVDDNTQYLNNLLRDEDKQIFPFDVRDINWPNYLETYCLGVRQFLMKNSPDSLGISQKRLKMLTWMNLYIPLLLLITTLYLVFVP